MSNNQNSATMAENKPAVNQQQEVKEYRKIATVKAKVFEKGDEDGMVHRDGVIGAMEDAKYCLKPDLKKYVLP